MSAHTIKKSGFYEFAITSCAKNWLADYLGEGGFSRKHGIMLAPNSHSQGRKDICTTNHGTASKRPCFKIEYTEDTSIGTGTYFLQNYNSRLNLTVDGKTVIQDKVTNTMKQQWTVKSLANGYYSIANRYHGGTGYLTAHNSSDNPSIWVNGTGDPVRFKIIKNNDGTGTYRIHTKLSDHLDTLSICNGSLKEKAKLGASEYTNHAKRKWVLRKVAAAQLQADISIKGMLDYKVTTLMSHPITANLYSPYTNVSATQTLFQIYNSSGGLEYSGNVSTPAFKGDTLYPVVLNWKPGKTGRYTVKVTADVKHQYAEVNENNNTYSKTITVIEGYKLQVKNYYDEGFLARYGANGVTQLKRVTRATQEFYRDMFGVWLIMPEPERIISLMDECKKSNQGGVNGKTINNKCTHSGRIHTERENTGNYFRDKYSPKNTAMNKIIVQWTGHYTFNGNRIIDTNRSFTYSGYHYIMMLHITEKDNFFSGMLSTYIHEIGHNLDAPDHYCYNAENETGKCENTNCIECYKKEMKNKCSDCIMFNSFLYSYDRKNWNTIICQSCKTSINNYLQRWCAVINL